MLEYALIASCIGVVAIAAVSMLGTNTGRSFEKTSDGFAAAGILPPTTPTF